MAIKIEREYEKFKVSFLGDRNSIVVSESQIGITVAHYYGLKSHQENQDNCPICKRILERAKKTKKK